MVGTRFGRRLVLGLGFGFLALGISLALWGVTAEAHPGHQHDDQVAAETQTDQCGAGGRCSHGPDPAPPGVDPAEVDPPADFRPASFAICAGNGTSGERVQVLYVHASDRPNRFAEYAESFRGWAAEGDAVYQASAAETGGMRYIRFVHDANCRITVLNVTVTPNGDNDFWSLTSELEVMGFTNSNRKYLVFLDSNHPDFCGQADVYHDSSPGADNTNNVAYGFAVIYNGCWSSNVTIAHELGHNFGAVQRDSPNASRWDHCVDEWDVMCYDDYSGVGYELRFECEDYAHNERLDCNNDDYFSTDPEPDSYLATHWNIANSDFLGTSGARLFLDKEQSKYNGWVSATMSGFGAGEQVTLYWYDLSVLAQVHADNQGNATARFRTPLAPLGTYAIRASDPARTTATDLLRVIPRINLSEFSGIPGSSIRVYCYGYAAGEDVEVWWYGPDGDFEVIGTVTIADNGRGTSLVTIPYAAETGAHTIRGSGDGHGTTVNFTVIQTDWQLVLSKTTSKYNGAVVATMTGFAPNAPVSLRWPGDTILGEATTDGSGSATISFRTPLSPLGDYTVLATDSAGQTDGAKLRVIPRILLNEDSGYPGSTIRVYFYGFAPGDEVDVRWYALDGGSYDVLATVTIADNGRGTTLITIPVRAEPGGHRIRGDVVGVGRSASTAFEVISPPWHLTLDKVKSKYNGRVTATMTGFAPNSAISLTWEDGTVLAQTTTDGTGAATAIFRTPLVPLGNYTVTATDSSGAVADTTLRVIPRIKLTEYSGEAGLEIRVYFYGFAPGNEVEIKWYDLDGTTFTVLETVTIADNGRATSLVTIPVDAEVGDHRIRGDVIGVSRSASDIFEVTGPSAAEETTATPTPEPSPTGTTTPETPVDGTPVEETPTEVPTEIPTETPTAQPGTPEPVETVTPDPTPTETPTADVVEG